MQGTEDQVTHFFPGNEYPLISYGLPFPQACAKHFKTTLGCSRVFIIASGSLCRNTDAIDRLQIALGHEHVVGVRRGMQPHVLVSEVLEVAREVERANADCIITLGGGSLIDAAKIIPFTIANEADTIEKVDSLLKNSLAFSPIAKKVLAEPWQGELRPSKISLVCVPTTLSGGEFNVATGGTNDITKHKQLGYDPSTPLKLIIWDTELVMTTPMRVWLSTGMRAVDHCVESFCAKNGVAAASESSSKGLKLLIPSLLGTKKDPADHEARLNSLKGGRESMIFLKYGVAPGGSHGIGHQVGAHGVPHGECTGVMLPSVLKYNATVNDKQQRELLEVLWGDETTSEVLRKRGVAEDTADLRDALRAIVAELGLPGSLKEVGIEKDQFDSIAESSLHDFLVKHNPRPLTEKSQVMEILEMAA